MANNDGLYNAAVVAENPDAAFIVENGRLHAVEKRVAALKKDQSDPKNVLPLMRNALQALLQFASGKLSASYNELISMKPNEQDQLIEKINHIYLHLHHNDRNKLSSMIHHKAEKSWFQAISEYFGCGCNK